jgi:hypothetical protein
VEAYIALHLQIILMFSINIGYIYSLFQFWFLKSGVEADVFSSPPLWALMTEPPDK